MPKHPNKVRIKSNNPGKGNRKAWRPVQAHLATKNTKPRKVSQAGPAPFNE